MDLSSQVEDTKNDLELDEKRKIVKEIKKEVDDVLAKCEKVVNDAGLEIEKVHRNDLIQIR